MAMTLEQQKAIALASARARAAAAKGAPAPAAQVAPAQAAPPSAMDQALELVRQADFADIPADEFKKRAATAGMSAPLNPQEIAQNDQMFGFGDELSGLAGGVSQMFRGKDFGKSYAAWQALQQARRDLGMQQGGIPAAVGSAVGNLTSLGAAAPTAAAPAAATWLGKVGNFAKATATGAATGATMGGVQGFGEANGDLGNRLQGAQQGAEVGGVMGAAAPAVVGAVTAPFRKATQEAAINAAIKDAPSADELANTSRALFDKVDRSGVTVDMGKFSQFVQAQVSNAKKMRINPTLDPKATGAYHELIGALDDAQKAGKPLTISDLHTLRQIAQRAAVSTEGRDGMFANRIVDGLDGFVAQGGNLKLPGNRIGASSNAGNDLLDAIGTWGRSRRVGLIEEAIYKAGNQASGVENGLRTQFRALLQNKKTRALFTPTELAAIQRVADGTATSNVVRLMGKFGFGGGTAGNAFGGLAGLGLGNAFGGPAGAVAAAILGSAARKYSGHLASSAAGRAARIVATPAVPTAPIPMPQISGTTFPLLQDQFNQQP